MTRQVAPHLQGQIRTTLAREPRMSFQVRLRQPGLLSQSRRRARKTACARAGGSGAFPDHRQGLGHHDAGAGGPGVEGHRNVHDPQGRRHRRRIAVVDAEGDPDARQQHAVDGRSRTQAIARYRRRGLSPARRARDGTAYPGDGGSTRRRIVRGGQPVRSGRSLCAQAAAVGDLRTARASAGRSAEIHCLGQRLHPLHRHGWDFSPRSRTCSRCGATWNGMSRPSGNPVARA